jgi:hypothetical protein
MRDSDFDVGMHALDIGPKGMRIAGLFTSDGDVIPSAEPIDLPRTAGQERALDRDAEQS